MIYLGHFSMDMVVSEDSCSSVADFTLVVEEQTISAALGKFRRLIQRLRREHDVFDGAEQVYLQSCAEIRAMPADGFMPWFQMRTGAESETLLSMTNAGISDADSTSYSIGAGPDGHQLPFLDLSVEG